MNDKKNVGVSRPLRLSQYVKRLVHKANTVISVIQLVSTTEQANLH